jgi:ABC-type methionine transport system ATPase subunit
MDVGFVWQATARNLVPYLSVQENIELPMAIAGVDVGPRRAWSLELLEALDMSDKAGRFPHQLSGGEQQRVAIATAMSNRPPLLLADEPTGELDTQMADQVFELLRYMNRTYNVTTIIVTHHPGVAHAVDRVLHIRDGRISSESFLRPTFDRSGDVIHHEYLVVDRVGRLQLPPDYVAKLQLQGLATADIDGDKVTIKSVAEGLQSGQPDPVDTSGQSDQDPGQVPGQDEEEQ